MTYGVFTVGLLPQGLQVLQIEIMRQLRTIAGNFSQLTALSHSDFLQQHHWPTPARLLLQRVEGMIQRYAQRPVVLSPNDIVLKPEWMQLHAAAHLLRQAMTTAPTAQALQSISPSTVMHACFFCDLFFATVRAQRLHLWTAHGYRLKHFRSVSFARDTVGQLPYCKFCDLEFSSWHLFHRHMASHVEHDASQAIADELTQQLQAPSGPVPSAPVCIPVPASADRNLPAPPSQPSVLPQHFRSELFDKARSTPVGLRALQLIHAHDWNGIKADAEVKQWLSSHCVICNVAVGQLKKMNMHMRQQHQPHIDGLYQTAGTVLRRCGTASPCEFCNKEFQVEHLCPAIIQASMVLLHELPFVDGPEQPAPASALPHARDRRILVRDFVLARDSHEGQPKCSHCHKTFGTLNGLKMHHVLDKCPQFDIQRSCTPIDPDAALLQNLREGTLMAWLSDPFRRMQWTNHCQTCGLRYTGVAALANHLQTAHSELWHSATTCTSFLSAYVHTIHRCVCNLSPGHMRTEHQCLVLRQVAMQYIRARDAGQFKGLFLPYNMDASELSVIVPHAPKDFITLLLDVITVPRTFVDIFIFGLADTEVFDVRI
eukprot:s215_g30.t1